MKKDLLRLIYQRRFKLMNRWNSAAVVHQPKFGGIKDVAFRSFIFHAFEKLIQALRQEEKEAEATGPSLIAKFDFQEAPDLDACQKVLEMGIGVLAAFLDEDPTCRARFPKGAREAARRSLQESGLSFIQAESRAYQKRFLSKRPGEICNHCGRPLAEEE